MDEENSQSNYLNLLMNFNSLEFIVILNKDYLRQYKPLLNYMNDNNNQEFFKKVLKSHEEFPKKLKMEILHNIYNKIYQEFPLHDQIIERLKELFYPTILEKDIKILILKVLQQEKYISHQIGLPSLLNQLYTNLDFIANTIKKFQNLKLTEVIITIEDVDAFFKQVEVLTYERNLILLKTFILYLIDLDKFQHLKKNLFNYLIKLSERNLKNQDLDLTLRQIFEKFYQKLNVLEQQLYFNKLNEIFYNSQNRKLLLRFINNFNNITHSLIQQQIIIFSKEYYLQSEQIQIFTKFNLALIEEISEGNYKFQKVNQIISKLIKLSILKFDKTSLIKFDQPLLTKIMLQFWRYQNKILNYLFAVDRIQASEFLINFQAQQAFQEQTCQKVKAHNEEYLLFLITQNQINNQQISGYIFKALDQQIQDTNKYYLKLNLARHLIYLLSKEQNLTNGDLEICNFLHKLFINNRKIMDDLVYQGFPTVYIKKIVRNIESLHACMQNAEALIQSSNSKEFIINFFVQITTQYPNERSQQILEFISSQVWKGSVMKKILNLNIDQDNVQKIKPSKNVNPSVFIF